ncbi:unnamed protein product [Adineta ricciae]|uniref:Cytochrome P450 n=1 Tax=Adineta ricciae TaxID=249248 RepID=A0A815SFC3_ADIRI|nr:unnamed protein product [Adineta ricciae]CAF1489881.1 unnamed protein product [Adineta ricciae]
MFSCFVLILIVLLILIYYKLTYKSKEIYEKLRSQNVPGEPFVPIFGQIKEFRKYFQLDKPMEYQIDLQGKYGDLFVFSMGPFVTLVIIDADLICEILTKKNSFYTKPQLFRNQFSPISGKCNLVLAEGEIHQHSRQMLNPAFHYANLQFLTSIMSEETMKSIERWKEIYANEYFDIQIELHALSFAIICSSSFGMKMTNDLTKQMCQMFKEGFDAVYYRTNHYPIIQIPLLNQLPILKKPILDKNARIFRQLAKNMVQKRKIDMQNANFEQNDLLNILFTIEDEKGEKLSDEQIENEAIAFIIAGHETTGSLLIWTLYLLLTNSQIFNDCRNEIDEVLKGKIPEHEDLIHLPILDAIIQETLRLYPPVSMVMRQCIVEHKISNEQLTIPVGTGILFNFYNLHRSEKYWKDPNTFDYHRWMRNSNGFKPKLSHPFAYLPFSAGNRNCIGQNFALIEAKIIMILLIQRLNMEIEPEQKILPTHRITLKPKYGIRAKIQQRNFSVETN